MAIATEKEQFFSNHEEADIRIFLHLNHAPPGRTFVMRTDSTDSLVIALGCKHSFNTLKIWLGAGVQDKNNLRFINVNSFCQELGETLRKALSVYHALTGCDYTAWFFKKGNVRLLKYLEIDIEVEIVPSELPTLKIDENTILTTEGYFCKMYASKNICKVNDLRTHILEVI